MSLTWATVLLLAFIVYKIGGQALPAMSEYGLGFLTSTTWDVNAGEFGILPEIWGTLFSSILALIIGGFFGISIAVFLTQDFLPPKIEMVLKKHHRTAGRHSQRCVRPVGYFRSDPPDPAAG